MQNIEESGLRKGNKFFSTSLSSPPHTLSLDLLLVNALHVLKEASHLMVHLNALSVKMAPSLKVLAMQHVVNVKLDRT